MIFSNTSLELVRHGKQPRDPMTNDERLRRFRLRMAAMCTTEFNTVFLAGRAPEARNAKRHHAA